MWRNTKINGKHEIKLLNHRADFHEKRVDWEVERMTHIMENLRLGDVVFDIGSEEGDMSALFAKKVQEQTAGLVVMFEPSPRYWFNTLLTWVINDLRAPKLFPGFATDFTDEPEDLSKKLIESWGKISSISTQGGFRHVKSQTDSTPCIKIDDYCNLEKIWPCVMTIDVEGSELKVIKGAKEALKHCRLVYVSIHPKLMIEMYGETKEELIKFMNKQGFKEELLAKKHEEHYVFAKGWKT